MKKILYVSMLLVCVSIAGCKKEPAPTPTPIPTPSPEPQKQEFVATLATPMTKTTVTDAGKVSWESTDAIAVFDSGKEAPVKATIKSVSSDGKTAVFTPTSEIANPVGAIYPYDANATVSNNVVSLPLKGSQSGAFSDANIAASKADGYNLSFQNATSVFKFKISDENVKSVKLSGSGIGGTLNITLGSPITSALSGTATINEITVSNITSDTDYYITIAPKTYDELRFIWYDNAGAELGSSCLGESTTVNAGTIYTWGDLTEHQDEEEFVQFEDAAFKAYCVENFDTDGDGEISIDEALEVTEINVDTGIVCSLVGIEHFANLADLTCTPSSNSANSKLISLDVSKNTALTKIDCCSNNLTSLNVSKNTALAWLNCCNNQLTSLDVSKNITLAWLNCGMNQLITLDVSHNTALTYLECFSSPLFTLDVSKNTALTTLSCDANQLTSLDVSGCSALATLICSYNQLTTLDVSKNTALTKLSCHSNNLSFLDVSKNTALTRLNCQNNQIPYIYVWDGFVESEHSNWEKDSSSEYVVKGAGIGGIDDYSVDDIWGNSGSNPGGTGDDWHRE